MKPGAQGQREVTVRNDAPPLGQEPPGFVLDDPLEAKAEVRDIGEARGAKVVERYDYLDVHRRLIYQVERMEPKTFRQRRPHPKQAGQWVYKMKADRESGLPAQETVLYRIPELSAALADEATIFIAEGEKDVNALVQAGEVATTNTGGAGKWRDELSEPFRDWRGTIKIVRDRDDPGEAHAAKVFGSMAKVLGLEAGAGLMIVEPKVGKDASDHLGTGLTVADFVQVWPLPENLIEEDPKRFKQIMLKRALEVPELSLDWTEEHRDYQAHHQPPYESGLLGLARPLRFQGCVVVSGLPSTAKSYLATGCAIDNALAGWDTFLLKCELAETVARDRAARAVASRGLERFDESAVRAVADSIDPKLGGHVPDLPERFRIVNCQIGVTIENVVEWLIERVSDRPTLVIIDSLSSFIDNMAVDAGDAFGMAQLRNITRWVTGVSDLTHGQISFLLLSEINKEGRAKGRSLDHRCDIALAMTSSEEEGHEHVKDIRITKNWHGPTGRIGSFAHWWQIARLCRIAD